MGSFSRAIAPLLLGSLTVSVPAASQQDDITFVVAGKTSNHRQAESGTITPLNYHFFAEIFLKPDGRVSDAFLTTPGPDSERLQFADSGYALEVHGGRYAAEAELEANYPDGNYLFHYRSPGTGKVSQAVTLGNPRTGESGLPPAPHIHLRQAGRPVSPGRIDPGLDLEVRWSAFERGGPDPAGIMDDLLFVIMGDCDGVRRAHSGRPYEDTPFLTWADTRFSIEAARLKPGNIYQLSVEHAVLDTSREHGVVGFATFASTTFLDITTTGEAPAGEACDKIRRAFDAGQTDRRDMGR